MTLYDQFIQDVTQNPDTWGSDVKKAVHRHLRDLERSENDPDFEYYFCQETADRYIDIAKIFKHTKGSWYGKPFNLQPFQGFILSQIFGWLFKSDGLRKYSKAFIDMGRGGGKSEFAALLQNILFLFDNENTPNILSCATTRTQANFVFKPAMTMLKQLCQESAYVSNKIEIYKYYIEEKETGGTMGTLTAEADKNDGGDIYMGTVDELHAHKDTSMIKIIETGQAKRVGSSPLLLIITTAGHNKQGPGFMYRRMTKDILDGVIENEGFFCIVFSLDDEKEVHNEKMWKKANPALGSTPSLKLLRQNYVNAMTEGATALYEFMTKNMNMYVDAPKTWIENKFIKKVTEDKFDENILKGRECYIGLDLSQDQDITASPILFLPTKTDPYFRIRWKFYCPKEIKLDGSKSVDGVDYRPWIEGGYIDATDGNVISYSDIENFILDCNEKYKLKVVEYDPMFKVKVIPQLQEKNIKCESYSQGFSAMTGPVQWLYQGIVRSGESEEGHKIKIEYNPVAEWMFKNVVIVEKEGMKRMSKDKSMNKIDGCTAIANAVGGYLTDLEEDQTSIYETRDMIIL